MAAKEVIKNIKLQIPAGAANPSPPVGPALGQAGVNIMEFCKAFNDKTSSLEKGMVVPVVIEVYKDKSFSFVTKLPPVSYMIKKALNLGKGSKTAGRGESVAKITKKQITDIATAKMPDLNCVEVSSAYNIVAGQCVSMGIAIEE